MNLGSYYHSCAFILYTNDITRRETFENVPKYDSHMSYSCKNPYLIKVLVGCKSDLQEQRQVTYEEGASLVESLKMTFHFEVSNKTMHNVEEMFHTIFARISEFILARPWPKLNSQGKPMNIERYGVQIMGQSRAQQIAEEI